MQIILATNNSNKLCEIEKILSSICGTDTHFLPRDYRLYTLKDKGIISDPVEDGKSFLENALIKARSARAHENSKDCFILAEDSGLCVEALGGLPGVDTAYYAGKNATADQNNQKLIKVMKKHKNRQAYFVTCAVLMDTDGSYKTAYGKTHGKILEREAEKKAGFGYDPLFYSDCLKKPFSVASDEEKNSVSHRASALLELFRQPLALHL